MPKQPAPEALAKAVSPPVVGGGTSKNRRPYLTREDIATHLAVSVKTLKRMAATGSLPAPDLFIGRSPRWKSDAIDQWLSTVTHLATRGA